MCNNWLLCTMRINTVAFLLLLLVSKLLAQDMIQLECFCDVDNDVCNSTTNRCNELMPENNVCRVDYHKDTGVIKRLCSSSLSSCRSSDNVLSACCETPVCNECSLPEELTYLQCEGIRLPAGCPEINCTRFISAESTSTGIPAYFIGIAIITALSVLGLGVLFLVSYCVWRSRKFKKRVHNKTPAPKANNSMDSGYCSSSKRGCGVLVERNLADDITLIDCIGRGGYGEIWRGNHLGYIYAIKQYHNLKESKSWDREWKILSRIRHPNIIICHDCCDLLHGRLTMSQFWMVMEYHRRGNLSDYLASNRLQPNTMFTILIGIANALSFLHQPYKSRTIAHRDLKTQNVLVADSDGKCVLSDFGLSITEEDFEAGRDPIKIQVGTKRYLAPEILDSTIAYTISSFCTADIYSFGLIIWEVMRRVEIRGHVSIYAQPYFDDLPPNSSLESVQNVVLEQRVRPEIPEQWQCNDQVCTNMVKLVSDCWAASPGVRPNARGIKIRLSRILEGMHGAQPCLVTPND